MLKNKDYSTLTREALIEEEETLKSRKVLNALLIGASFGVAIYAAVNGKFLLPVLLMLFALRIGYGYANNLRKVREEIERR